jgi:hypothetical protein
VKLRIHGNSLRLRLDSSEVAQLRNTGLCSHTLHFGSGAELTYSLETSSQFAAMDAQYRQDRIRVLLPLDLAREWAESDRVSLSLHCTEGGGPSLLIEKDLRCLHRGETRLDDDVVEK